ncbi:hypothetical protein [Nocardia sp. CDC160]|uniref:hypothetical protein n=1 Tax=Nocardia sp. CDC160 TaxID=3112166 RepID=UPI002DBBAB8B|nr:hypothetical protein [Nocardia sp. CDC160]MEC3918781.1 hypothetical protein [Nocardia sp. CDC160]
MLVRSTETAADSGDCAVEPRSLTYRQARSILRAHDQHFACRQYLAAVAYLSADNDVD